VPSDLKNKLVIKTSGQKFLEIALVLVVCLTKATHCSEHGRQLAAIVGSARTSKGELGTQCAAATMALRH
jgi:hypothetical protein